jgi:polyisoprenoid-binding protein YceI
MKNLFSSVAIALIVILSAFGFMKTINYNVDANASKLTWVGYKVGGKHNGDLKLSDGKITMSGVNITSASFTMDMNSITVLDLQGGSASKLLGHLKSDDFFSVTNHPKATFELTKATYSGKNQYDITGNLTIKGITKEISFPATVIANSQKLTVTGTLKVNRTKWDITYRSDLVGTAADKLIDNEFEIGLNLVANNNKIK